MAKRNNSPVAPQLVVGTSVAQALAAVAAAPAPVVAAPKVPVHPLQVVVGLGKPYNVRPTTAANNAQSWQTVCAFLAANGGSCTVGQLQAHLQATHNHASFAGYVVKRGYLAPVQQAS